MALSVNGQVAPNGIVHGGLITENQVNAYNNALSVVAGSTFYDAELYLLDQGDIATVSYTHLTLPTICSV